MILPITSYTESGRVGSSSIYCATIADKMAATSQHSVAERHRRIGPAAIINITNPLDVQNELCYNSVYEKNIIRSC